MRKMIDYENQTTEQDHSRNQKEGFRSGRNARGMSDYPISPTHSGRFQLDNNNNNNSQQQHSKYSVAWLKIVGFFLWKGSKRLEWNLRTWKKFNSS